MELGVSAYEVCTEDHLAIFLPHFFFLKVKLQIIDFRLVGVGKVIGWDIHTPLEIRGYSQPVLRGHS